MKNVDSVALCTAYDRDSKSYLSFVQFFKRQRKKLSSDDKFFAPSKLASLFLDCFLTFERKICSETVVGLKLCEKGKFTEWRNEQKRLGNLDWDSTHVGGPNIRHDYKAGKSITHYMRKVGEDNDLMASKGYVDQYVDQKVDLVRDELNQKIESLQALVGIIVEKYDPPGTPEKCDDYTKNPDKMLRLINSQS